MNKNKETDELLDAKNNPLKDEKEDRISKKNRSYIGLLLLIGLFMLLGVGFLMLKNSYESYNAKVSDSKSAKKIVEGKKPWEKGSKNPLEIINKQKKIISKRLSKKKSISKQTKPKPLPIKKAALPKKLKGYVCVLMPKYNYLLNKSIVWFYKTKKGFVPSFKYSNWNHKGFSINQKTFTSEIDIENKMAKLDERRWVPILDISNCTVIQDK